MKTCELTGHALNWAVAKAANQHVRCWTTNSGMRDAPEIEVLHPNTDWTLFAPSTHWAQAGPIIERERIEIRPGERQEGWFGSIHNVWMFMPGPTPLIAAMRCYVASKLGDEVAIPKELL